ncbi:LysR substrate-binding domain-containing protein [Pseudomonas chlororaphis]|uniref:LysR substrate-binding domain-containing protein n=1 Tax=Pseudomonas chlororaphis TaxID=587753 RepID=UPI001D11C3C2|nr:LysR substrate-binding domain-containing protein [Pseudomonas chlororaphis]
MLPLMPQFMKKYPAVTPEWHFDNRQVELIADGFDAAIGGGIELSTGLIARDLASAHLVLVASPDYLSEHPPVSRPGQLSGLEHLAMRSLRSGKIRSWMLQGPKEQRAALELHPRLLVNDPQASWGWELHC